MENPGATTILVAATDPNIMYLLKRYAEASGFQTVNSGFGDGLIQLARQVLPILIVLQIDLSEPTWQQSLQMLKTNSTTKDIPVMAFSCIDEIMDHQIKGVTSILPKSFLYNDFLTALEQVGLYAR